MILQHNSEMFEYRESGSNLFCFSLGELIHQAKIIYGKDITQQLD